MIENIKPYMASMMMAVAMTLPQCAQGMDLPPDQPSLNKRAASFEAFNDRPPKKIRMDENEMQCDGMQPPPLTYQGLNFIPSISKDMNELIITEAVQSDCYNQGHATNIALVCKNLYTFIKTDRPLPTNTFYKVPHNLEESCLINIFMTGELVFRPNPYSDEGMIRFKISDFENPLEGKFDLSPCSDAGGEVSIHTGYYKRERAENENKVEIWLTPRFLIKKELATTAQNFKGIIAKWQPGALIGLFWTWGNWDNLNWSDYLTSEKIDDINSKNLYEDWLASGPSLIDIQCASQLGVLYGENLMFTFSKV
jgi:hypothetical protein